MKQLFDNCKLNAREAIIGAKDAELFSNSFAGEITNRYKIVAPSLDKTKTDVQIGEEIVSFDNAPSGISFTPGQKMEFALFKVPVIDKSNLFEFLTKRFYRDGKTGFDGRNIYYKEISQNKITGNDDIINSIKENAKALFSDISRVLGEFEEKAVDFNENEFKSFVFDLVEEEKKQRNAKGDSENKLNPFI